eukprot:CAMPEP_0176447348 /NCGR_PEP_ID=MMETSP0127-20121128/24968_1 /TAXON_ID=938130 /ORGANISM="Platyophrya macrostoma, Strain WH" /LENGTH=224 /DNA_ID=CAMNT_0017833757 /DNA_START=132 /DNA_END=806 /DNA_ORIENTATION=-
MPEDVPIFAEDVATNFRMFHPLFVVLDDVDPARLTKFIEITYQQTARSRNSLVAIDTSNNQIVSAMLATDEAHFGSTIDIKDWPEFHDYWVSDELLKKIFSKIFDVKDVGISSVLWGAWTHKDYRGLGIYRAIEECYYDFPKFLAYKNIVGVTVHEGARKVSGSQKGIKSLLSLHYRDLQDAEGNYIYRDQIHKFLEKGFKEEDLKFTFMLYTAFQKKQLKPKL